MTSPSEDRIAKLRAAKLAAIARDHLDVRLEVAAAFPDGAAGHDRNGVGAVLIEAATPRSLGAALIWSAKVELHRLSVIVGGVAPPAAGGTEWEAVGLGQRLARQAGWFASPAISVFAAASTGLVEPVHAAALPVPPAAPPAEAWELAGVLVDAGLTVVAEHGVIWGEVDGLGVACVTAGGDGVPRLELGVGRFDREIGVMLHGERPDRAAIETAAALVRRHRRVGAPPHPVRDLVPERWVRQRLLAEPALVGASSLEAVESTLRPETLRERQPAAAFGVDLEGRPMVVVASSGLDVDLVPHAADTRGCWYPEARLVLAVTDAPPATAGAVAGALRSPLDVVVVPRPWER